MYYFLSMAQSFRIGSQHVQCVNIECVCYLYSDSNLFSSVQLQHWTFQWDFIISPYMGCVIGVGSFFKSLFIDHVKLHQKCNMGLPTIDIFPAKVDENHKTRIEPVKQPYVKDVEETNEQMGYDNAHRKLNISGITYAKNKASSMVERKHNALYQGRDSKFLFMSYRMQSKEASEPQQRHSWSWESKIHLSNIISAWQIVTMPIKKL